MLLKPWWIPVEAKVVELNVTPSARELIDDADEDRPAHDLPHIDYDRTQVPMVFSPRCVKHLVIISGHDLHARLRLRGASDQVARIGIRNNKRFRCQRPLRSISIRSPGIDQERPRKSVSFALALELRWLAVKRAS